MDNILDKLSEMGLGQDVSKSRDEMIKRDNTYNANYKDLEELEEQYKKLDLSAEARVVIDDYISCKENLSMRVEDISYIAGIKDTILFFGYMGLLKDKIE